MKVKAAPNIPISRGAFWIEGVWSVGARLRGGPAAGLQGCWQAVTAQAATLPAVKSAG